MIEIRKLIDWDEAKFSALITQNKKPKDKYPTEQWKEKLIKSEHSPIRKLMLSIVLRDIPSFVATHLVRHVHMQPYVGTSRSDLTGKDDSLTNRLTPVTMELFLNAQEILNISRQRLCYKASKETREIWIEVLKELKKIEPILVKYCVPNCIYRNGCPEFVPCGVKLEKGKDYGF